MRQRREEQQRQGMVHQISVEVVNLGVPHHCFELGVRHELGGGCLENHLRTQRSREAPDSTATDIDDDDVYGTQLPRVSES